MGDATMKIDTQIVLTDTLGIVRKIPVSTPAIVSQKEILQMEVDIAVSSIVILWDPTAWTGFPVSAFQAILVLTDFDVKLEETVKKGDGNVATNVHVLTPDTPYILGSNVSTYTRASGDGLAGGSVDDVIDRLRIENESASQVAKVTLLIVDAP